MNPQGQPGDPNQPQYPQHSSPNGVPPIPNNPWQQTQQAQQTQQPMQPTQPSQPQPTAQPSQPWPQPTSFQQPQQAFTAPSGNNITAPEYSIDYLNQIAPKQQKSVNRFALFAMIGGIIFAAIVALMLLTSSQAPSSSEQIIPIAQRITTLQAVTTAEQKHLSEDEISEANAALTSSLTSMNTNITAIMQSRKLKVNSKSASSKTEAAYAATLTKTLEDSYQKGTLDRTYTTQMTYELTMLNTMITKLKKASSNAAIQSFCTDSLNDINTILQAYTAFNATKS